MRAHLVGRLVQKLEKSWDYNGRSGISYQLFIRPEGASEAASAQLVKATPKQFAALSEGTDFDYPVDVYANTKEWQGAITGAKLSVSLPEDLDVSKHVGLHSVTA